LRGPFDFDLSGPLFSLRISIFRGEFILKLMPLFFGAFLTLTLACSPPSKNSSAAKYLTKIIGGNEVTEGSDLQKSIVGIYDKNKGALCSGSLIAPNVVLTAAHCIGNAPGDHTIIFAADLIGTYKNRVNDPSAFKAKTRTGVKIAVNENYKADLPDNVDNTLATNDLGLIQFEGMAPEGFKPATFIASADLLVAGTPVTVAGYGVANYKLDPVKASDTPEFKKSVKDHSVFCDGDDMKTAKCFKQIAGGEGHLKTTNLKVELPINATEVVLNQTQGTAACEGDSGGPAYLKVGDQYQLWGVASRVSVGCDGYVWYTDAVAADSASWIQGKLTEFAK
jgi:secreted trypsin-like serine protease